MLEQPARVEGAGRGLGMELHRGDRQRAVAEAFVGPVVEVGHRRFEVGRQRRRVDGVAMVVRGDQHFVINVIFDGLVPAAMAVGQLVGVAPQASASS